MITLDELTEASDRSLAEFLAHVARTSSGGAVRQDDGMLLFAGGHNYPGAYTNGVMRLSADVAPARLLARADDFFGPLRRGYVVWVRDHADGDLKDVVR